jgi:hypothetical protein
MRQLARTRGREEVRIDDEQRDDLVPARGVQGLVIREA